MAAEGVIEWPGILGRDIDGDESKLGLAGVESNLVTVMADAKSEKETAATATGEERGLYGPLNHVASTTARD